MNLFTYKTTASLHSLIVSSAGCLTFCKSISLHIVRLHFVVIYTRNSNCSFSLLVSALFGVRQLNLVSLLLLSASSHLSLYFYLSEILWVFVSCELGGKIGMYRNEREEEENSMAVCTRMQFNCIQKATLHLHLSDTPTVCERKTNKKFTRNGNSMKWNCI